MVVLDMVLITMIEEAMGDRGDQNLGKYGEKKRGKITNSFLKVPIMMTYWMRRIERIGGK